MKTLLPLAMTLSLCLASLASADDASVEVAKVDYSKIDSLLESVVLSQPANKELGERFRTQEAKSKEIQTRMQEAIVKGEKFDPMMAASGMMRESKESKQVELLCEKHLIEIIEKTLGDKYQIVLKSDYGNSLLYTKIPIDDVTALIRQELLKQLPKD